MSDVTICTVSFHNAEHLRLNRDLAHALNRADDRPRWVVAENSPPSAPDRLPLDAPGFTVIEGEGPEHTPNFQHTLALHKCFAHVETRFLLVLDPDFYIVRPNWAREVTQYMQDRALTFFGVPWHPRFSSKYRYFPAVHCFFVDLEKVAFDELDFRPSDPTTAPKRTKAPAGWSVRFLGLEARRKEFLDTGTRMYRRFANGREAKYECALPVFRLPDDAPISRSWRTRLVERVLPDDLCYLPKRRDSYTATGLRELGLLTDAPRQWEEFMWKEAPFGFHVRRNASRDRRDAAAELTTLRRSLELIKGACSPAGVSVSSVVPTTA